MKPRLGARGYGAPLEVEIDERLREIDYGVEGRSSDETDDGRRRRASGGSMMMRGRARRPPLSALGDVRRFSSILTVRHARIDPTLIVSSNGMFKLFATSIAVGAMTRKMGTGHLALLGLENDRLDLLCWNVPPDAFPDCVSRISLRRN